MKFIRFQPEKNIVKKEQKENIGVCLVVSLSKKHILVKLSEMFLTDKYFAAEHD